MDILNKINEQLNEEKDMMKSIEMIAKKHLGLKTLKSAGRDDLDFSDQGVASIKNALMAAYKAGMENKK